MADLQNPKAILKLWKKANEKHGFGNDVQTKALAKTKPAAADLSRVVKKLTNLQHTATELPFDSEAKKQKFDNSKKVAVKCLQKCCRTFKSKTAATGDVKDFNKMRKVVLQVTKVVSELDPGLVENGDAEPQLTALDSVKTDDLEVSLNDEKFGKFDDSELDKEDEHDTTIPVQDKKTAQTMGQPEYEKKLQQLAAKRQQAQSTPFKDTVEKLFALADKHAKSALYGEAINVLEKIESFDLKIAPDPGLEKEFMQMVKRLMDRITEAKSVPGPTGAIVTNMLDTAKNFATQKQFGEAVSKMKELEQKLNSIRDAHGNVRELANKEDAMVSKFIGTVLESPRVMAFQKKKFSDRMNNVAGKIPGVNWDDMIGTKAESDPFDVISQIGVFKEGATDEFDEGSEKKKISYLTFQDAMYGDEMESRAKLVMALASKKMSSLTVKEDKEKLQEAVRNLKEKWQVVKIADENSKKKPPTGPPPTGPQRSQLKEAVDDAFALIGFKSVSDDVQSTRDQIKNGLFLGKDNPFLARGRKVQKGSEKGRGIGDDETHEVRDSGRNLFMGKNVNVRDEDSPTANIFRELSIPYTGGASGSTVDAVGGIVDDLVMGKKEDQENLAALVKLQEERNEIVKGLEAQRKKKMEELVKTEDELLKQQPVDQGKVAEMKKTKEATQLKFDEDIKNATAPFDSKIEEAAKVVALKDNDPRLAQSEAEICMYIMGMHSAGHHSIVEMLFAAKQYPQKFFRKLRDPITEFIELESKRNKFYASNPLTKFQKPKEQPQLDNPALFKLQQEAMLAECPDNMISGDECVKEFMKYAGGAIQKV